ncbi:MAG: YchJ family metal-binding protein [Acidimicrobiales bacterium]
MANQRPPSPLGLSLPATSSGPASCPCGSGSPVTLCCGRIHADPTLAVTAEQLMRARYSAFVLHRRAFLEISWHSSTRPDRIDLDHDTEWLGLTITKVVAGGPKDDVGEVAFIARLREAASGESVQQLVEHSRFVREDGRWRYLDALR